MAAFHYGEAEHLGGKDGIWQHSQVREVPWILARAQMHASLAAAVELRALRLTLGGDRDG